MDFEVYNFANRSVLESVDIDLGMIETETLNESLLSMHINRMKAHHLSQRKAKTRNQSEVHGTTAKAYKQKGTGRARRGSKKSGIMVHGGTIFGPRGMERHISLPKGEVKKVKRMVLAAAIASKKLYVVSNFAMEAHKTKGLIERLSRFADPDLSRLKCLMVFEGMLERDNILSARNLSGVKYASVKDFTVHNLIDADFVLITKEAITNLPSCLQ